MVGFSIGGWLRLLMVIGLIPTACPWTGFSRKSSNGHGRRNHPSRHIPSTTAADSATSTTSRLYYTSNITLAAFMRKYSNNTQQYNQQDYFIYNDATSHFDDSTLLFSKRRRTRPRQAKFSYRPEQGSVETAIQQVHAIMDLQNLTKSISTDIVTTSLDGLIQKIFRDKMHLSPSSLGGSTLLKDLEELVYRCVQELQIPWDSPVGLETLLTMRKQVFRRESLLASPSLTTSLSSSPLASEPMQHCVDACAKLLRYYCRGNSRRQTTSRFVWPQKNVLDLFDFAKSHNATMTPQLWNLFQYSRGQQEHYVSPQAQRDIVSNTLQILARSDPAWMEHQYDILITLERQYQQTNNTLFLATSEELHQALESCAVGTGEVQHATLFFRKLYSTHRSRMARKPLWRLLLQTYAHSNEPGAVSYMELLVRTQAETQRNIDFYNIVLQARSCQRQPGTGLCAEQFLTDMLKDQQSKEQSSLLQPNMESLYHVVSAYLNEEPAVFQNVMDADAFARRLVSSYNMTECSHKQTFSTSNWETTTGYNAHQWPMFERLLYAYASFAKTDPRAGQSAAKLFRFFLKQRRHGRVCEQPTAKQLALMLGMLRKCPNKKERAKTSLELFDMFISLETQQQATSTPTAIDNHVYRQLLDTLANSGQKGYGVISERIYNRAIEAARVDRRLRQQPEQLDELLQRVVQCQKLDGNVDRARQMLEHQGLDTKSRREISQTQGAAAALESSFKS